MELERQQLLHLFRKMLEIRRFEERAIELYQFVGLPGFLHTYIGQEGIAVGVCAHLRREDYVTSTHRGHGHCIAKGAAYDRMLAELYGKESGYCRGKGGSMHIVDFSLGILGANGIVGGGLPMAVGAALSAKMRGTDQVAVAFFGDGGSNIGTFHESLNLAAVWGLPVIFVCENNRYAESTPQRVHQKIENISQRAIAYDMPGLTVDGSDVMAVYTTAGEAVARARKGDGPTLLECKVHRLMGHYVGDPDNYRSDEEKKEGWRNDPIERLANQLKERDFAGDDDLARIRTEIDAAFEKAVAFASQSPEPKPEQALEDLYV